MDNYFDKNGNYINVENLSLADIYHRAFALGVEFEAIDNAPEEKSYAMGYQDGLEDGLQDIRPQGHWIFREDYKWHCSVCDAVCLEYGDKEWNTSVRPYCYSCGAKMEMREGTE